MRINMKPGARLPVGVDWSDWLLFEDPSDEITASTWDVPDELLLLLPGTAEGELREGKSERVRPGAVVPGAKAVVWVRIPAPDYADSSYVISNSIETREGREESYGIEIRVMEEGR